MSVNAKEYGYFFNSQNGDRTYNADSFETWLKPFFVSGVFAGTLQVKAQDTPNMSVKVTPGFANLDGKPACWTDTNTLEIETASGVYSRFDNIVLRRDNTNRQITLDVVKGTAAANPEPPAPTRTSDVFELVIAQILVGVGVTEIKAADITDTRTMSDICGYVTATVEQMDFDQFKEQFDGWVANFEEATEEEFESLTSDFMEWFDEMKDQLSEDAAGHLQLEIGDTTQLLTTDKSDLVSAINELITRLTSGAEADASLHLGFYLDQNGDLCQVEENEEED